METETKTKRSRPRSGTRPTIVLPAVVACGYRRIKIPKSGNSFPAFLVAFDVTSPSDPCKTDASTNVIKDGSFPSKSVRFAWRSKKDFLLLARKTGGPPLPRAALKKIVDETTVPWRRCRSSLPQSAVGVSGFDFDTEIPACLRDPDVPNRFEARMKKSIWQLDRFLQSMQNTNANANANKDTFAVPQQTNTSWDVFCRHSDTEDLVHVNIPHREFAVTPGISIPILRHANTDANNDAQDLDDPDENDKPVGETTLRESSRLGQYFASKQNSRRVVECALEKILPLYNRRDTQECLNNSSRLKRKRTKKILFVEPSCGHGDIIVSLVEALKQHEISPSAVWIMGCDIDPCAIHACRQRNEFFPGANKISNDNNNNNNCNNDDDDDEDADNSIYPVLWECKSFFETTRENCIQNFDAFSNSNNNNSNNNDKSNNNNRHDGKTPPEDRELLVCCLGGPPYTTGQGSGSSMKRDLPERFVDHCFAEWKADAVSFLLPARYRQGMSDATNIGVDCDDTLSTPQLPQAQEISTVHRDHETISKRWICETQELDASTFFFRGTTKVTQPSIIQIFFRPETRNVPHSKEIRIGWNLDISEEQK